jgi:hypothetical protein
MGDPKYIKKLETLYGVNFGNVSEELQTEMLLAVKRFLTKKEYKVCFQFMDLPMDEVMEKVNATQQQVELHHKKAVRKLKDAKLQNFILALLKDEEN